MWLSKYNLWSFFHHNFLISKSLLNFLLHKTCSDKLDCPFIDNDSPIALISSGTILKSGFHIQKPGLQLTLLALNCVCVQLGAISMAAVHLLPGWFQTVLHLLAEIPLRWAVMQEATFGDEHIIFKGRHQGSRGVYRSQIPCRCYVLDLELNKASLLFYNDQRNKNTWVVSLQKWFCLVITFF